MKKGIMNEAAVEYKLTLEKKDFNKKQIKSSKDAADYIRQFYYDDIDIYESCFILLMNRSNTTIGYAKISQGGTIGTVVDVKIVCKYAIESLSAGVILAHNHPSGQLRASSEDTQMTRKVKTALQIMDIALLDSLILTSGGYFSFADEGIL